MKLFIITLSLFLVSANGWAQDKAIIIHKDERIDQLLDLYSRFSNIAVEMEGFRIQILTTTMRDKAYSTEGDFKSKFSQYKTYLTFTSPYFKLRVGDFEDRQDANRDLQMIKQKYPASFIVNETINTK